MSKLIFTIVLIVICAIFFIQNMVKVPVNLIVTSTVEIRLTYLLLTAFVAGYITCIVQNVAKTARRLNKKKMETEYEDDEEDLDDDFDH